MRDFIVSDHSRISFYKLILATQHGSLQRFVGITRVGHSRNSVQREGVRNLRPLNAKNPLKSARTWRDDRNQGVQKQALACEGL